MQNFHLTAAKCSYFPPPSLISLNFLPAFGRYLRPIRVPWKRKGQFQSEAAKSVNASLVIEMDKLGLEEQERGGGGHRSSSALNHRANSELAAE